MLWLLALLAGVCDVTFAAQGPQRTPTPPAVVQAFADSQLVLNPEPPARFLLSYRGPVSAFRGRLCYRFAGYTETCFDPKLKWLTPATTLTFYAPGGVPLELLRGYRLEVRAPDMFQTRFSYYVHPE